MKLRDLYSYMIANWLNGGTFSNRSRLTSTDIQVEYNRIFTRDKIKSVIRIEYIKPLNEDACFVSCLRDRLFEEHPNVEVQVIEAFNPVNLNVTSDKFNRSIVKAEDIYSTYKSFFDSQSNLSKITGKSYRLPGGGRIRVTRSKMEKLFENYASYLKIFNAVTSGSGLTLTNVFIELIATDGRELNDAVRDMHRILNSINMHGKDVKGCLKNYLTSFAPSTFLPAKQHRKFCPQLLFTDDNSSAFSTYQSRGLISSKGLVLGIDVRSKLPFMLDIFSAPSAQVMMLLGRTGSGKTYAAFMSALSALAMGCHVSAIDIKGREWSLLTPFCDTKIITLDSRNPSFVNTLRLDDLSIEDEQSANELYETAVSGTVCLLSLMVNIQDGEGNENDLSLVLKEAVTKLYSTHGITPQNPKSFQKSATLSYRELLPVLESLSVSHSFTPEQRNMIALAKSRCNAYLSESGLFSEAFKHEISLSDILNNQFVIYEFNKNQGVMTDSLDIIRIFMVQFLDSKKKAMLKSQSKFLFCYYEELQRCDQFGNLLEYICADVTGSRSNNAIIYLLLNSIRVLDNERARDIRSNITTFMVGKVNNQDIDVLRDSFGLDWLSGQLELFNEKENVYRNCFACHSDTGVDIVKTVFRVDLPKEISAKFRTRTILEDSTESNT